MVTAVNDTIFLEFGGMSKTCLTAETACHSLDQAVKHAQWANVSKIVIQGHAELIGEIIFDSNADTFKKTPTANIKFEMTLSDHVLSPNDDNYGIIRPRAPLQYFNNIGVFYISTSRTPGGTKKNYVFRVEEYGVLELSTYFIVYPLQLPSTTTFTKLTSNLKAEPWDQKSAAIIVNKGAFVTANVLLVYDPELGVLILNDVNITKTKISLYRMYSTTLTSLVPKGIVCSIPNSSANTLNITIIDAGRTIMDSDENWIGIDQFPLDINFSGKCSAYDAADFFQLHKLNKTDFSNLSKSAFIFPRVELTRSDLKVATQTGGQSSDLGNYLLATFISEQNNLNVEALRHLKVSIAPRYHTEDTDDAIIRWDEMTWYVGLYETTKDFGGTAMDRPSSRSITKPGAPLMTRYGVIN
ncbi:hypothetical protein BLNAU_22994 [Blattamonas nauphoetae]|uniref:Uncharacterized protein n=1 Tax=Blattamonas nauphoetae TaxID=2049346 RepID=A0ABQ9WRZ4_9EUKA|nr:hypothetical protein BLNAU_22994 [Blattamonas nauphoetae]